MKKNLLAILMTSVLCFGLVACGNEQAVADTNAQTETVDAVEETTEETTEETEEVTDATALDEADATATEGEEEISFTAGVVDNTTYTNEDLGIKINLTEDWYIANDDEKAQIFGMTTEVLNTADLGKYLENGGVYLDFFAQNTNTAETVNISVQKLQAVASIAASALDDQQYIDTVYDQMISSGADKQLFASLNITDGKIEKGTTTVAGVETPCLFISGTMNSNGAAIPVFETQIYKRKFGVSAVITSASYNTNTSENAFQMFE